MLSLKDLQDGMSKLNDWSLESDHIMKVKELKNFKEAMEYVNKVALIAEEKEHHPSIEIDYNKVILKLTTHEAKGLSYKDFQVAELIDKI